MQNEKKCSLIVELYHKIAVLLDNTKLFLTAVSKLELENIAIRQSV